MNVGVVQLCKYFQSPKLDFLVNFFNLVLKPGEQL